MTDVFGRSWILNLKTWATLTYSKTTYLNFMTGQLAETATLVKAHR
ncbi:MAG: hypothetical protein ACRBEQ_06490 [Hyphomonas sp.]